MSDGLWHRGRKRIHPAKGEFCVACHQEWPHPADPPTPLAIIRELIEAGDGIRCYPSGAVGFDEWGEVMAAAELVIGQWVDEDGTWRTTADDSAIG